MVIAKVVLAGLDIAHTVPILDKHCQVPALRAAPIIVHDAKYTARTFFAKKPQLASYGKSSRYRTVPLASHKNIRETCWVTGMGSKVVGRSGLTLQLDSIQKSILGLAPQPEKTNA